jgi:ketosteroid isomerase-like protein
MTAMNRDSNVDQVRNAFAAQAVGDLEPARQLLGTEAILHLPAFLAVPDPRGFDGLVALMLEMMSRSDGGFASTLVDVIGAGDIVTTINEVNATRDGQSINYHTVWTFRFADAVVAEAWLHPSVPGDEIRRFYGFATA